DDAVDRRFDADFAEIVAGVLEAGALLRDPALLRADLFLALLQQRFGRADVVLRLLERLARRQLLRPEVALPRQRLLRLLQLHPSGLDRLPHLVERLLGGLQRGVAAFDPRAERLRVDLQQGLALLDPVGVRDCRVDDAAGRFGADFDQPLRLHLARRRDDRLEIAGPDRL